MPILRIDHLNVMAPWDVVERCRRFYVETLGLVEGERPPFRRRGFWLYAGGSPIVHLSEAEARESVQGPLDHVALACTGAAEMMERLRRDGVPFEEMVVPRSGVVQLFVRDPAGVMLELNFAEDA